MSKRRKTTRMEKAATPEPEPLLMTPSRNNSNEAGPAAAPSPPTEGASAAGGQLWAPDGSSRNRRAGTEPLGGYTPTGGPAQKKLLTTMLEEKKAAIDGKRKLQTAMATATTIESNKYLVQDIIKAATAIFSSASIAKNPDTLGKIMVNGKELCTNLGSSLLNIASMCSALIEISVSNLVNSVDTYLKSDLNNGILLGMMLTVLIQKREVLSKLQLGLEGELSRNITKLIVNLNKLTELLRESGKTVIGFLLDYLSAGPVIERIGDIMTDGYKEELEKVKKIDSKLREQRKADLIKKFNAANAETAIKEMLNEKKTPAQKAANHPEGTQSQGANGGHRSRWRTKRRGTKSMRKHTKKRTKRRRKHSRSTKKMYRVSKMKKRKTKRCRKMRRKRRCGSRKMRGGGKWGTGPCPGDFTSDSSKTGDTPPPAETPVGGE